MMSVSIEDATLARRGLVSDFYPVEDAQICIGCVRDDVGTIGERGIRTG